VLAGRQPLARERGSTGRMRVVLKRRPSPRSVGVSSGEGARQLTHRSNPPSQPFDPPYPSTFDQQSNHPRPQPPHHFDSGRRLLSVSHLRVSPRAREKEREIKREIARGPSHGSSREDHPSVRARRRRQGVQQREAVLSRDEPNSEPRVLIVEDRTRQTTRAREVERTKEQQRATVR